MEHGPGGAAVAWHARHVQLAAHGRQAVLRVVSLWRDVRRFFYTAWSEVDVEDVDAPTRQVLLLASHAWALLDGA